jgi:hypothetical protein
VVDPHVLAPQGVHRHADSGEYEQDPAIDYVESLAFAFIRGTFGDAIYRGEECEDIQSCGRVSCVRCKFLYSAKELVSPNRIPANTIPTYMDLSNGISIGVLQTTPESAIVIKPQISGARVADPVKRGDKKLKPVGERLADGLILFEKTLFIQCKDMI